MFFLFTILLLFILFSIPIPISLKLEYVNSTVNIYLYNKKIDLGKLINKNKKPFASTKLFNNYYLLKKSKLKPSINLKLSLKYGFEDAFLTGVSYGLFSIFNLIIYHFINNFFSVKKYNYVVMPIFNKKTISLKIDSIIFINLVKIIYICFIFIKNEFTYSKGGTLNGKPSN